MVRAAIALAAVSLLLAGCGTPGADLFVVTRSGSVPGAGLRMRAIDDGQVVCNGTQHELPSGLLIQARALSRDLADPAKANTLLPPGREPVFRYRIRTEDGTVAFSDDSRGQPAVFYRAALLVRQIAKGPCGLPR